jgi:hypothetical protein
MDQERAVSQEADPTPVFAAYRRGYDPEQVDRYISDQHHRLDEALERASEAERRLAAAVGQLRELHRRVAMLENENRSQTPPLDMLGERVQRILQEAWEGAYQLRQAAEHDVAEEREQADREVAEMLESARRTVHEEREQAEHDVAELLESGQRRAMLMRAETERRRQAYLEQVQEDREQAVNQISYLHEQRQSAVSELARLQANLEATVAEMARSPIGVPSIGSGAARHRASDVSRTSALHPDDHVEDVPLPPTLAPPKRISADRPGLPDPIGRASSLPTPSAPPLGPDPVLAGLERSIERFEPRSEPPPASPAPPPPRHAERSVTAEQEVFAPDPEPRDPMIEHPPPRSHARKRRTSSETPPGAGLLGGGRDSDSDSGRVFDFEDRDK